MDIKHRLSQKLKERQESGNLRTLKQDNELVDFVSNDYLGLSRSKALFDQIQQYSYEGITHLNGSTGSRLLAGNSDITVRLEEKLAHIFQAEKCLLFNSGYVANLALLSTIPQRGDTIIYDQLAHVCLKEGAALSHAKSYSFKHNDCADLEAKLKKSEGNKFVVIESVYSMDGDRAPLADIIHLAKVHNAKLIIDEAHGTGIYGPKGSGLVCDEGLEGEFFARVYTFGKAMGVHGACVAGSEQLIDYLINFARPFIYTTALPVHSVFSIDAAFDYIDRHIELQNDIAQRIEFFNAKFDQTTFKGDIKKLESATPIQPIIVPGNERAKSLAHKVQEAGFDVRPVLSPTVKEGSERLRICLHTFNTENEITELIDVLSSQS